MITVMQDKPLIYFNLGNFSNIWEFYDDTDGDRLQIKLHASYDYHESYPEEYELVKELKLAFNSYDRMLIEHHNNIPKNVKMKIVIYEEEEEE
jgi:hypothetical protein